MQQAMPRRQFMRLAAGAVVLGAASPLLACRTGDGGGASVGPAASAQAGVVTVKMGAPSGDLVFSPDRLRIRPGETVEWVVEAAGHSATAYHPDNHSAYRSRIPEGAEPWDSGLLAKQGDRFRHTFTTEGVYHYYCIPHEGAGMVGAIVVGSPAEGAASAPVQPEVPEAARRKLDELIAWAKSLRT